MVKEGDDLRQDQPGILVVFVDSSSRYWNCTVSACNSHSTSPFSETCADSTAVLFLLVLPSPPQRAGKENGLG